GAMAASLRAGLMGTATCRTGAVTWAAGGGEARGGAARAGAGGAVSRGAIRAGAVCAVVTARAASIRDFVFVMVGEPPRLLARGIWVPAHGAPMSATLNVCIVGCRCPQARREIDGSP